MPFVVMTSCIRSVSYTHLDVYKRQLQATSDPATALRGAELVFLAVPSQTLRENLTAIEPYLSSRTVLVSLVKGVEKTTTMRMSEVIADTLDFDLDRIGVAVSYTHLDVYKRQVSARRSFPTWVGAASAIARSIFTSRRCASLVPWSRSCQVGSA